MKALEKENEEGRIGFIEILRVFSMISVVFLHTAAGSLRENLFSFNWHALNFITSFLSASVPVFFMISGALILSSNKTDSISYILKNRVLRILVPLFTWSAVALLYNFYIQYRFTGSTSLHNTIDGMLHFPSKPLMIHLWFLYALLPVYLLSPILKKMVESLSEEMFRYLFVLWFVFSSLLPTMAKLVPESMKSLFVLHRNFDLNFIAGYLGYFILGYYFYNYRKEFSKRLLFFMTFLCGFIIATGTWWRTEALGTYQETFKEHTKIFTFTLAILIFLLAKQSLSQISFSSFAKKTLVFLTFVVFGLYLVHNLYVGIAEYKFELWPASSFLFVLGIFISVVFLSLFTTIILSSIKPLCFMFTGMTFNKACKTCNLFYFYQMLQNSISKWKQNSNKTSSKNKAA